MSQRESNLLWLKDVIEHLSATQQQLMWAEDQEAVRVLTETMIRDLDCCKRIAEAVQKRCKAHQVA